MQNVLRNWKTSAAGLASLLSGLGMLGAILNDLLAGKPPDLSQLAAALGLVGAGVTGLLSKDADKTGTGKPTASPVAPAALALLVGALLFAGPARADELQAPNPPPLGGTFLTGGFGRVNYGPALLPGMLALDLSNGNIDAVQIGGLSYGIMAWADKPYSVGFAGFLSAQTGSPGTLGVGGALTLFKYMALGLRYETIGGAGKTQFTFGPNIPL